MPRFSSLRPLARIAAALVFAGAAVTLPASTASAAPLPGPVTKNLTFTCEMPLIGARQVAATVTATFPGTVAVGSPIDVTGFSVAVSLDGDIVSALNLIGAATIDGTASANVGVDYNGTELGVTLNGLGFPATAVPQDGPLGIVITGPIPGLTVKKPGSIVFTVGGGFTGKVTPKRADGTPTDLGTFDLPCGMDPGQDASLATVTVN
ncbi:DUF6801 domain-containing protein [Amycolatopsis azurea]|uniref:DUF6801 domain-containing protein n=1 Tax=Amycolatopsis azurea DSM 43854 TaxID=1238180 RepID=M2Q3Q6_9PSEU|nr:DUF6801 domain-containing protein [Amycolatopsis azurea]EMD26610.1 hypothetical protein C791_3454 [Amycolatopsis azurea DSM 43854]OOC05730.1 hypothetical protein B0293_15365 [Amycolatopsis azurea DSM 43854]